MHDHFFKIELMHGNDLRWGGGEHLKNTSWSFHLIIKTKKKEKRYYDIIIFFLNFF